MAKTTVFSWKVTDSKYGYLWTEETNGPCITNRITDPSILEEIVGEISGWDEATYASNFDVLSNLIHDNFGQYIEGDYSIYYNGNNGGKSFIMLTGKDGANSNGQGNSDVSDAVLAQLKTYITNQVTLMKENVKADMNDFKASTNQKIEVLNTSVNEKIDTTKNELVASTTSIIDSKMTEISNGVRDNVLAKLEHDVPVSSLQELVNGTKMHELESFVDEKTRANANAVSAIRHDVDNQNERIIDISASFEDELRSTNSRIDNISDEVARIDTKVERVAANKVISEDVSEEITVNDRSLSFAKGFEDDEDLYALETETIDNGDGTFDIIATLGSETYNIRILAFGNRLKVADKTQGLVLASNGIKYADKSGSSISIINGNIKLSNADGSGKLEIKKDGLYINGVKQ
jgi:hypothetical protein